MVAENTEEEVIIENSNPDNGSVISTRKINITIKIYGYID